MHRPVHARIVHASPLCRAVLLLSVGVATAIVGCGQDAAPGMFGGVQPGAGQPVHVNPSAAAAGTAVPGTPKGSNLDPGLGTGPVADNMGAQGQPTPDGATAGDVAFPTDPPDAGPGAPEATIPVTDGGGEGVDTEGTEGTYARNTLTRRIEGPISIGTIELDYSSMKSGDAAGLAAFRDSIAWLGVKRQSDAARVVMKSGMDLSTANWRSTTPGREVASEVVSGGTIWLRVEANIRTDSGGGTARFSYSTDGSVFQPLGSTFSMRRSWNYFLGYLWVASC